MQYPVAERPATAVVTLDPKRQVRQVRTEIQFTSVRPKNKSEKNWAWFKKESGTVAGFKKGSGTVAGFKKGSGTVAGTARRVLRTTVPDPFLNRYGP